MGLFFKISGLFDKNKPHKELMELYSELNTLGTYLAEILKELRILQKQLVGSIVNNWGKSQQATGGIGLKKTEFIIDHEEGLIDRLKKLAEITEKKFLSEENEMEQTEPVSIIEKNELKKIINFLEKLKKKLPEIEDVQRIGNQKEKLVFVENALREVTQLSQEFHEEQKLEKDLIKKVLEHEISPLLRRVYESPTVVQHGAHNILTAIVSKRELKEFVEEAKTVNQCQDENYKIIWRQWWKDDPVLETDVNTPIKDPHINITMKLFRGPKKDIHLLIAA